MGLTLALIFSGVLGRLSFWRGLESLVVLRIEAERCFHCGPCLEAGVKGEVILTLAYGSEYLWT